MGSIHKQDCLPVEVSFQADQPDHLGIIEYHSASRTYPRQPLQGINLDARSFQDQRRQQRLYNWQAKYQNVKTELATGYLRALIAEQSGDAHTDGDLNETLKELFKTFFPDKVYEGVKPLPQGGLEFPVRLPGGEVHDIDDLSSGEKEILYGYLRLRNSIPRESVILLDEPELHLNPSLLQGFPDFYYRHLGVAQGNQLWLVTHSDTLLRQAIGNSNYRVYHMVSATTSGTGNQATEVLLDDDVDRAVVDLVGDLAAYRPHAKVVILEGKGDDSFDVTLVQRLFPEFAKRVNLVSVGYKRRVRDLYDVLEASTSAAGENRFFAIVDRDSEGADAIDGAPRIFRWDRYHIENYLLEPSVIRDVSTSLAGKVLFASDQAVMTALKRCAKKLINKLVLERIQAEVNAEIVGSISIGGDAKKDVAKALRPSIEGSVDRVIGKRDELTVDHLSARVEAIRQELNEAITTGAWREEFPGRSILTQFVTAHLSGVSYTAFRNLIADKMVALEQRPSGMFEVLKEIEPTGVRGAPAK